MLLPGRQAFTNFMDQQAFMIDWTGRAAHEEGSSIQVHAQSHQLKRNFAEVTRLTHPLGETWAVALGNQLWLSQQFYFDTHQSANKRQEFASPSENEALMLEMVLKNALRQLYNLPLHLLQDRSLHANLEGRRF